MPRTVTQDDIDFLEYILGTFEERKAAQVKRMQAPEWREFFLNVALDLYELSRVDLPAELCVRLDAIIADIKIAAEKTDGSSFPAHLLDDFTSLMADKAFLYALCLHMDPRGGVAGLTEEDLAQSGIERRGDILVYGGRPKDLKLN